MRDKVFSEYSGRNRDQKVSDEHTQFGVVYYLW
jgi:hypothetical protein